MFKKAKALGDKLIVGVVTDEGVKKYKREPIIPFEQRMEIVSSIKYVDMVVKQNNRSGTENIKKLGNISVLIRGDDAEILEEVNYIKSINAKFIQIPYTKGISSSGIMNKILTKNY